MVVWRNKNTGKSVKQRKRLPDNTCRDRIIIQEKYYYDGSVKAIKWIMDKFGWRIKPALEFFNELRGRQIR
jgi:hypothetical protein